MTKGRCDVNRARVLLGALLVLAQGAAVTLAEEPVDEAAGRVRAREAAFARTMADRDASAFASFVSEEAVFLGTTVLRGREAVVEGWARYFQGEAAPFSWEPERVEVLDSGHLAISTGPVRDPEGRRVGTYNSTWRLEPDGEWRVVLDSGCPPCSCPEPAEGGAD